MVMFWSYIEIGMFAEQFIVKYNDTEPHWNGRMKAQFILDLDASLILLTLIYVVSLGRQKYF